MKKYIFLVSAALLTFFVLTYFFSIENTDKIQVAITQIAPHPSLDTIRRGIMDRLEKAGIPHNQIIFQNAQGSPATALQIAQKFVSLSPRVIVAITTPSAQAAVSTASPAGIPVIFSAISDPEGAKLTHTAHAIAGVCDRSPIKKQIKLIRQFLPKARVIGVLYNAGEANSVSLIQSFEHEAKKQGFLVTHATVMGTNNVGTSTSHLIGKVDAIYIPNDNTVISAFDSVIAITQRYKVPVFTADPDSVKKGALASIAYNQYEIGTKTGDMILDLLQNHTSPHELGIQTPSRIETAVNIDTARHLTVSIPKDLDTPDLLRFGHA